jgi:phage recombination protein Bet
MAEAIVKAADVSAWTADQRDLIKRTVAKDASDDELQMFLHVARVSELDPLLKQIHFTKMGGRIAFIADVNGLQARASRAPDFEGIACAVVYEKDDFLMDQKTGEVVKHVNNPFNTSSKPVGAWAVVRRAGKLPFVSCVRFTEYDNPSNALWKSKPSVMVLKCAKSTALRLAYPEKFSGVYDEAELGKEERELNPAPEASVQATHAAAVKQQLKARFKVVDQQAGESEAEATARTEAEAAKPAEPQPPKALGPYERIWVLLNEYDMPATERAPFLRRVTGRATSKELVEEDVAKVAAALAEPPPAPGTEDIPF